MSSIPVANLLPVSLIPAAILSLTQVSLTVVHLDLRISPRIFEKILNNPNGILWGWVKTDSWKNQKQKIFLHCPFNRCMWWGSNPLYVNPIFNFNMSSSKLTKGPIRVIFNFDAVFSHLWYIGKENKYSIFYFLESEIYCIFKDRLILRAWISRQKGSNHVQFAGVARNTGKSTYSFISSANSIHT